MVKVELFDVTENISVEAYLINTTTNSKSDDEDEFTSGFTFNPAIELIRSISIRVSSVYVAKGKLLIPDISGVHFGFKLGKTTDVYRTSRNGYGHIDALEIETP